MTLKAHGNDQALIVDIKAMGKDLLIMAEPIEEPIVDPVVEPTEPIEPTVEPNVPAGAKYTDDDVDAIVKKKLAKAKKEQEEAVAEAKRLAKLSADEQEQERIKGIEEENAKLKAIQAKADMKKQASLEFEKVGISNIPDDVLDLVSKESADDTNTNIKALTAWKESLINAFKIEFLKGDTPKEKGKQTSGAITKAQFDMMNVSERVKALDADPNLTSKF